MIDGQGGGIGTTLIKYLKEAFAEDVELVGLGTNAIATAQMLKAGANKGASGENVICRTVMLSEYLVGPIAVSWANAMLGEVTPKMAEAVSSSPAYKLDVTEEIGVGEAATTTGKIHFRNSTSATEVTLQSGVTSSNYILTLPASQGGPGYIMVNDGSGNLFWVAADDSD